MIIFRGEKEESNTKVNEKGISVKVIVKGTAGFCSFPEVTKEKALKAVEWAVKEAKLLKQIHPSQYVDYEPKVDKVEYPALIPPFSLDQRDKSSFLHESLKPFLGSRYVGRILLNYQDTTTKELYMNTEGAEIESIYSRVYLRPTIYAKRNNKEINFSKEFGKIGGFEFIKDNVWKVCSEVRNVAVKMLDAVRFPTNGIYSVVLGESAMGALLHILSHSLEADMIIAGLSPFEHNYHREVAPECVNVFDDSTIPHAWGSYKYDAEGVLGKRKYLIKNGILESFLHSRESAFEFHVKPTANSRRDSYKYPPRIHCSNIHLQPGECSFDDLIDDIDHGLYIKEGRDISYVDEVVTTIRKSLLPSGVMYLKNLKCSPKQSALSTAIMKVDEAYLIEKGEIRHPIKGFYLVFDLEKMLKSIDRIGKVTAEYVSNCFKNGDYLPFSAVAPMTRVGEVKICV